jgi:tetraacyldisaccharide 4'-kinase
MPVKTPNFWFKPVATTQARLLYPLSLLYGLAGKLRRMMVPAIDCPVPLIVAGNAVVGGSGKTPLVIYLVQKLKRLHPDLKITLIGKGYGGREVGPLRVDPARHSADEVGDEALMLAQLAPTFIGRDRGKTYKAAVAAGAQLVISDDGLQNPALDKAALRFLVIGSRRGIGNGLLLPAGPLRESISEAASRAHAIIQVGGEIVRNWTGQSTGSLPVFHAHFVQDHPDWLHDMQVVAFCGLG